MDHGILLFKLKKNKKEKRNPIIPNLVIVSLPLAYPNICRLNFLLKKFKTKSF